LQSAEIEQTPHDLLLSAMHYRDELVELKKTMPDARTPLQRFANEFEWPADADERLEALAERIWRLIDHRRITIDQLFRQNSVCELKIYRAIAEMLRTGQIAIVDETTHLAKAS
jgi:hypothetical protein